MPDFNPRFICWTGIWLSFFAIAVVISVLPLHVYIPARCEILSIAPDSDNSLTRSSLRQAVPSPAADSTRCEPKIRVRTISNKTGEEFEANAIAENLLCSKQSEFIKTYAKGTIHPCWYPYNDKNGVSFVSEGKANTYEYQASFSATLRKAAIIMSACFGVCFVLAFSCIFKRELLQCCPNLILNSAMHVQSFVARRRRGGAPTPSRDEEVVNHIIRRPPIAASRQRISTLVEAAKLSDEEVRNLHADGWSCCICLEEESEGGNLSPVSRLPCNHATHSECLRSWLEKGRAVCCLCNAEAFPEGLKDVAGSSGRSSASGYDGEPVGSLEVERTEGAPSSPATSIFVEISQARSLEPRFSDDQDGDI